MRFLFAALVLWPALALGQKSQGVWDSVFQFAMDSADVASGKSIFESAKPDIIVQVSKHTLSDADMFEITAVKPNYPADLLRAQADRLCQIVGVPARGLRTGYVGISGEPGLTSMRATFATNGIIDREHGLLHIVPIVQAFAGAPAPFTVHAISILFNGEQPTSSVIRVYRSEGLRLQGVATADPPVVEFRVQLLTQDPSLLTVPEAGPPPEPKGAHPASTVQHGGVDWFLWIAIFAGAVAAGALVYSLMLRTTSNPRR